MRLSDVATVEDSVADVRRIGVANGKPSVLIIIFRQPGANTIETVDRVITLLPYLQSSISPAIQYIHRFGSHRYGSRVCEGYRVHPASLGHTGHSGGVRFSPHCPGHDHSQYCRAVVHWWAHSAECTFSGYSLDNLSLMALAISTGFVVDDAIVVLKNITRYVERGMDAGKALHSKVRRKLVSLSFR